MLSMTPVKVGLLRVTVTSCEAAVPKAALVLIPAAMVAVPVAVEPPLAVQVTETGSGAASSMRARTCPECCSALTSSVNGGLRLGR